MASLNTAPIAQFSSDRTIQDYAQDIWRVQPAPIRLPSQAALAEPDLDRKGRNGAQPEVTAGFGPGG